MTNPKEKNVAIKWEDIDTEKLSNEIRKHANESKTEEDLRIRVENTLRTVLKRFSIEWASYEHTNKISGGRKDALYGKVIIEYKKPEILKNKKKFQEGKNQLKNYIMEESNSPQDYSKFFGILIDGLHLAFVRYRNNRWDESENPLEVNSRTILRILEAIRGLRRKPLNAEEISKDFGIKSELSQNLIFKLFLLINKSTHNRSNILFEDWKRMFSQVCAYSKNKMKKLNIITLY